MNRRLGLRMPPEQQLAFMQIERLPRRRTEERGLQSIAVAVQPPHASELRLQHRFNAIRSLEMETLCVCIIDGNQFAENRTRPLSRDELHVQRIDGIDHRLCDEIAVAHLLTVDRGVEDSRVAGALFVSRRNRVTRIDAVAEDDGVAEEEDAAAIAARMLAQVADHRTEREEIG